jgi:hypothetical protein
VVAPIPGELLVNKPMPGGGLLSPRCRIAPVVCRVVIAPVCPALAPSIWVSYCSLAILIPLSKWRVLSFYFASYKWI